MKEKHKENVIKKYYDFVDKGENKIISDKEIEYIKNLNKEQLKEFEKALDKLLTKED